MLRELHIHNFAIIEDISLDFEKGMTVLTGETGAGKSIIIDALGLLAGGRGSVDFIRHEQNKCTLEGHFLMPKSEALEDIFIESAIDYDDNLLIIQREIYRTGRNVCRVNGSIVNISMLKTIGSYLIDIHGQNEHQELMQSENHIKLLDYFAKDDLVNLKKEYDMKYSDYIRTRDQYMHWKNKEQELAQKIDILNFQTKEIEEANLVLEEEELLLEEEKRLANFQKIVESLSISYQYLQEIEQSALSSVGQAMDAMKEVSNIDENLKNISVGLNDNFYQLQELSSDIYRELDKQEFDENRLNEISQRLNLIQQLKRKYGESVEEILEFYEKSKKELSMISSNTESKEELYTRMNQLEDELIRIGTQLSEKRRKISKVLEKSIQEQLKALYMDKVVFEVVFRPTKIEDISLEFLNSNGFDQVEFYISTNPGEPLKPLTKVASGGELSRIMLALKTIFTKSRGITSIIFDEIDTGVSGRVAQAIAERIYMISIHSQVLCITHLPQVAAAADNHLYVEKNIKKNHTSTKAYLLPENNRIEEIARMLSGSSLTQGAIQAAKELRKNSAKKK